MKRYTKPMTVLPTKQEPEIPLVSDVSVQRLIDSSLSILDREVKNLMMLSSRGKLDPASARDLRDTTRLLFELKDRENESLRGITDEELNDLLINGKLKDEQK
jgi:hypothetical protein